MLKMGTIVALTVGSIYVNVQMVLDNKSLLLMDRPASNGWNRACTYYKPFEVVTVTRPAHLSCPRFGSVS